MELMADKNLITFGNVLISVKGNTNTKIRHKILKMIGSCSSFGKLQCYLYV